MPRRHQWTGRSRPAAPANDAAALTFNVSTLLQEPLGSRRSYDLVDAPVDLDGGRTVLSGELDLLRTDGSVMVQARLSLVVAETCGACLASYALPLQIEFEEEFWPPVDPLTQAPIEVPEGREGFPIIAGHLDLTEAVRQYVLMARPMRARCGADCPGPSGTARAAIESQAPERDADGRWAALRALREELDGR